ncbi:MAG: hypothetical protein VYA67_17700 [Actinomycetota bacterium]|nr:hypothetical protein [Actinomycetota bacterium]
MATPARAAKATIVTCIALEFFARRGDAAGPAPTERELHDAHPACCVVKCTLGQRGRLSS